MNILWGTVTVVAGMALLCACGSGGGFLDVEVQTGPPPPQPEVGYSPCGTYNGQPVVCRPLRPEFSYEEPAFIGVGHE